MSQKVSSTKKGIIYVMTSEIEGVVLISGMIDVADVQHLHQLFWYHIDKKPDGVAILNAFFAVEVYNTKKKLDLLYEVYKEQRLGKTQLFKVDRFIIKKLLVELGGKPVFIAKDLEEKEEDFLFWEKWRHKLEKKEKKEKTSKKQVKEKSGC